jgi:hypothetical protein
VLRIIKGTASRDFRLLFDDQTASVGTKDAEKKLNFFFSNTRGVIRIHGRFFGFTIAPYFNFVRFGVFSKINLKVLSTQ